jgi:predicted RNase H-like nuclease (RuvC/YqgF family)
VTPFYTRHGGFRPLEATICGVDIYPHYKLGSTTSRRYAVTILKDGIVTTQYKKTSRPRLLHLIQRLKPTFVAVDNVYELANDLHGLRNFFSKLPGETRVIQVTGVPDGAGTLQQKAVLQGVKPPSKISPIEEAAACAQLVEKGVGAEVQVYENEVKILVCRNVSLGAGGSSQTRYRRRIHTTIQNIAKKTEDALHGRGVDYDLFTEEADFGLERAYFHVYASRAQLQGVVKPIRGRYVKLKLRSVYKNKIEFIPLNRPGTQYPAAKRPDKHLIIGVDPGTNCGLAILTLNASPLYLKSRKGLTRGEITRIVMQYGTPLIVGADVTPVPEFVSKLATMLNAVLFAPESVLEASEKREITRIYAGTHQIRLRDSHARDALAAAIKAFQHYRNKFEQVEGEVRRLEAPIAVEEVKALVVRGQPIQRAIEAVSPKQGEEESEHPQDLPESAAEIEEYELKLRSLQDKIAFYKEQCKQLKASNEQLVNEERQHEDTVQQLTKSLETLRGREARELKKEREYQRLTKEIVTLRSELAKERGAVQRLEKRLETLRYYRGLESKGDIVFLKPVETFTKTGLEKAYQLYDIKRGDTILFLDASGGGASTAEEVVRRGVKAVVSKTTMAHQANDAFERYGVSVVPYGALRVEWVEGYPYVEAEELNTAIHTGAEFKKRWRDEDLLDIVEAYKRERRRNGQRAL